ncbi:MAG: DNA polymerase, partial [Myxococcota bacterium]
GLAYGMGPGGLANQLGCRPDEAEQLLEAYFRAFPRVRAYLEDSAQQGLRQGWVASSSGRRYWLTDMRREGRDEGALVRVAKNMPIQGTNADMVKIAMARLVRAFAEQRLDARLVNMVHDEIVVEADESAAEAIRGVMVNEMMSAGAEFVRQIPMTVDTSIAEAWSK